MPARPRPRTSVLHALLAVLAAGPGNAETVDPGQRDRVEQGAPLPLSAAAGAMTLPPGFHATLFAGEPDVHQPIALALDHRGRVWIAENDSYPVWQEHGKDKVVVLEDTDGDGRADRRTVFAEGFHYLSGVLVGRGGVWVVDAPNLLFFPVADGGDRPSGPPEVRLDGWSAKGVHNLCNSLTWGPDGWLYGCNGTIFDVEVGAPGTPKARRVRMNRGIWRYHPVTRAFEKFAEGTANPWGLDFDEHGEFFMSNNVVSHLWHVVQGGHYPRVAWGSDSGPHNFEMLPTIADHLHWGGGDWTESRGGLGIHGEAGGGHSHAGLMLYLGESFPERYRGTAFLCNTHGHRVNNDALGRRGSGFVARHRPDFLLANDPWFKGVSLQYGPDGSVYVIDWSDAGECHDVDVTDRAHGRVFRVAHDGTRPVKADLEREPAASLVAMQSSRNEWLVRHARTVLASRGLDDATRNRLVSMFEGDRDPLVRLRALWTLHACGGVDEGRLLQALEDADEHVRSWAVQLLAESSRPSEGALAEFASMARKDPSPLVRLHLASAMQRTPVDRRGPVLEGLAAHAEDADDPNLPLMAWYALEPVVAARPNDGVAWIAKARIPKLRELIARRMASP